MTRFVCAFRGRRDAYQVPLALAEGDRLDRFITDAYATPFVRALAGLAPAGLRAKAQSRFEAGIPDARVSCLWSTTALEHARHRLGYPAAATWAKLDARYGEAAARRARDTRADLFLYSPYAWEAFTASYRHAPRRVLFQYHPHPDLEVRLLQQDAARHPGYGESFAGSAPERHERDAWKHADLIFCASSFTRQSLVEAGCDAGRCRIVPYGINLPLESPRLAHDSAFRALFVGSGGQRKGLHHLLMAWKHAALPDTCRLTVVCRVIDRGIEALVAETRGIELLRGASDGELARLYARSSLMVMPSLAEGFGQVYLEALAQGCPVLGTAATALPDLGGEGDGVFLTPAGEVEALVDKLRQFAQSIPANAGLRAAARATASRFSWRAFREQIRAALPS
jgi:glycosyltransferase involved in cell wall biosynthesis